MSEKTDDREDDEGLKIRMNNLILWKKGESGNPSGKPKGTRNRSTIVKEMLGSDVEIEVNGETVTITQEELITIAQIKQASKGDTRAYNAIMDSAYGKPKQEIEQKNIDMTPPEIEFFDRGDNTDHED